LLLLLASAKIIHIFNPAKFFWKLILLSTNYQSLIKNLRAVFENEDANVMVLFLFLQAFYSFFFIFSNSVFNRLNTRQLIMKLNILP